MDIPLIYLFCIIYDVCLFTLTVRYSVGQFFIQIVKVMNIGQVIFYIIIYEVCVFNVTVRYSDRKTKEYGTNKFLPHYLWTLSIHCYSLLFSSPVRNLNCESNEYGTNIFL